MQSGEIDRSDGKKETSRRGYKREGHDWRVRRRQDISNRHPLIHSITDADSYINSRPALYFAKHIAATLSTQRRPTCRSKTYSSTTTATRRRAGRGAWATHHLGLPRPLYRHR